MNKIIATALLATALAGCQTTVYTPPSRPYYPPVYAPAPQPIRVCRWEREYNPIYRQWMRVERCQIVYR